MKKHIYLSTMMCLALIPASVQANTLQNLNQKNQAVQQDLETAKSVKEQTQQELNSIIDNISQLDSQLKQLRDQVQSTETSIQEREGQIQLLQDKIHVLKVQIEEKETKLQEKKDQITLMLRMMYTQGNVSMLEFIFRADNFAEFVNRYETYQKITKSRKKMYDEVQTVLASIENDKNDLVTQEVSIEHEKSKLEEERQQLLANKQEIAIVREEMVQKSADARRRLQTQQEVISELVQENEELEMQMQLEKQRIADEQKGATQTVDATPVIQGNNVLDVAYKWLKLRGSGTSNPVIYSMPQRQLNLATYGDCSSFTRRVFLDAGKGDIGSTTAAQITNSKGYFSSNMNELQPGDLMYFGPTGAHQYAITLPNGESAAVAHVAIYVGNSQMIDLSASVGTISLKSFAPGSRWSSYVNTRFIGLKRF